VHCPPLDRAERLPSWKTTMLVKGLDLLEGPPRLQEFSGSDDSLSYHTGDEI